MEFCRAGHFSLRGCIARAEAQRRGGVARAETRIPQPKAVRVADALAGVRRRGGEKKEVLRIFK